MRWRTNALLLLAISILPVPGAPPDDFPEFKVPGFEREMGTLRDLFWLHYPGAGPKATLWDEWLPSASLWPAVETGRMADNMRRDWSRVLSERILDPEGYVATHQHASIAHQLGWPFPFWSQGRRGFGWHFSFKNTAGEGWRPHDLSKPDGWAVEQGQPAGLAEEGWRLTITNAEAILLPPAWKCHTEEVPFIQVRWQLERLGALQPSVEWTTAADTNFAATRRYYFEGPKPGAMAYTMVPMYRHPSWTGEVARVRLRLGNSETGSVTLQALFSQYDTRHNINGQNFVRGCAKTFWWTRDLKFLRSNVQRMRLALRYLMTEHQALERKVVATPWVGHDGRSGLKRLPDGRKEILTGVGIGNNYWDIMPFGNLDCYATIQYYDALRAIARVEREIQAHPEWDIPGGALAFAPGMLEAHADEVKAVGNKMFWNERTGRFFGCIDAEGVGHEYGFTFLNLEAIYYNFATEDHAAEIMRWINGDRLVDGDTAQGADIYHWRCGPRATTRRNLDWYFWAWSNPESIPWGGQVQDGGAVLGFSYHDLMARLRTLGPDNAWKRLREIIRWFDEVQAAGGYRKYYNGSREGSLQGGGTAGGLGLDQEFFESALVPQVMLYGFMGFEPRADGFSLNPRLPADWPELTISRIRFQDAVVRIAGRAGRVKISRQAVGELPLTIWLPAAAKAEPATAGEVVQEGGGSRLVWRAGTSVILTY